MTGIRGARGNGFRSKTHGDSETETAASIGSTAIAGDGTTKPLDITTGIKDAGANGFNSKTRGDSAIAMVTYTASPATAGDGTMGAPMARRAASTTIAHPAIIEATRNSSSRKDIRTYIPLTALA